MTSRVSTSFSRRARAVIAGIAIVAIVAGGAIVDRLVDGQDAAERVAAATASPAGAGAGDHADTDAGAADDNDAAGATAAEAAPTTAAPEPTLPPRPLTVPEKLELMVLSVAGRDVAISVVDAAGKPVIEHRAEAPLIPASTAKLITAAAALHELGPDYRYATRVNSTAPVSDGVIAGDIVFIGAGDPALSGGRHAEVMPERPRTALEGLADQIAAAGAVRITGRLLADPAIFPDEPIAAGADVGGDSETRSSGLTVNAGRRVWVEPRGTRSVVSDNPPQEAAQLLADALAVRGVAIEGGVHVAPGSGNTAPLPLAVMQSPPMLELLRWMVQTSDNHAADAIFRTMGANRGDATWAGAAGVVANTIGRLGLDPQEFSVADGSGLSRNNRLSAAGLIHLDELMAKTSHAAHWYSLHAVAASSGTLRNRMIDTPAAGKVGGKTGTLRGVRTFTGYVTDGSKPRFRLAILGNDLDHAGIETVVRMQDEISVILAERAAACAGQADCPAA